MLGKREFSIPLYLYEEHPFDCCPNPFLKCWNIKKTFSLYFATILGILYCYLNMSNAELKEYLETAIKLAKEVGPAFTDGFYRRSQFSNASEFAAEDKEGNQADCVTAVDRYVEKTIFSRLREIYPHHKFVGEETSAEIGNDYPVTNDPTWIVDPVDGTNNFVHHFPYTGICIGLAINKQPVVGVIYLPILDELYTAAKGMGVFLNNKPLPALSDKVLTSPKSLSECAMITEHGSVRSKAVTESRFNSFSRLLQDKSEGGACLQNLRIMGAACYHLTQVAQGVFDVFWECGPHAWDLAAAVPILLEAGCAVFDGAGWWGLPDSDKQELKPLDIWKRKVIAIRHIPDLPGQPGSGKELQKKIAKEVLTLVEDISCEPDGKQVD